MTDSSAPAWSVIGQVERVGQLPNGSYAEGIEITFRTSAGQEGTVFVSRVGYTTAAVQALINERAATMAEVAGLSG